MRHAASRAKLAAMNRQRVILDADLDRSVIRGTLTAPKGERREFHGWLELNTALEGMLDAGAAHTHSDAQSAICAIDPEEGVLTDDQ